MATERIAAVWKKRTAPYFKGALWFLGGFFLYCGLAAASVELVGVINGKAIVSVDSAAPRTLSVGQEYNGVKILSVQENSAIVLLNGQRKSLRMGQQIADSSSTGQPAVVLHADARGHFITTGSINGHSIKFLVDTGASAIAIGPSEARRLNLDLSKAQKVIINTANGQATAHLVTFRTVKVGDITLHDVSGMVNAAEMPFALLGMSFLNRVNMQHGGDTMTLTKRF